MHTPAWNPIVLPATYRLPKPSRIACARAVTRRSRMISRRVRAITAAIRSYVNRPAPHVTPTTKVVTFEMVSFDAESFDHVLADFRLTGAHETLECESCHQPEEEVRKRADHLCGMSQRGRRSQRKSRAAVRGLPQYRNLERDFGIRSFAHRVCACRQARRSSSARVCHTNKRVPRHAKRLRQLPQEGRRASRRQWRTMRRVPRRPGLGVHQLRPRSRNTLPSPRGACAARMQRLPQAARSARCAADHLQ